MCAVAALMLRILTQLPKLRRQALASAIATLLLMTAAKAGVAQADWLAEMRSRIAASEFEAALAVVNQRLKQAPEDMEARGWRGRIQQWMGRLDEAEADYRAVLERHPQDTDILVGFADVLSRQGRTEEALEALEQARQADPSRTDVHVRRGQLLRRLERRPEARAAFQHALSLAPDDAAARKGLDSLQPEARHEVTVGADLDRFNYTSTAHSFAANLRSKLGERWTTNFGGAYYEFWRPGCAADGQRDGDQRAARRAHIWRRCSAARRWRDCQARSLLRIRPRLFLEPDGVRARH